MPGKSITIAKRSGAASPSPVGFGEQAEPELDDRLSGRSGGGHHAHALLLQAEMEGRVEMRLETTGRKELVRWILSWMPDVKSSGEGVRP